MRVWELGPARLMVAGAFADLAVHHHPAVQVTVGGRGSLTITRDGNAHDECRLVVVASGARHAVRSDSESGALTLYFGLQTPQGVALNALSRNRGHRGSGSTTTEGDWPRRPRRRWTRTARMPRRTSSSTSFAGWTTDAPADRDPFTRSYGRRSKSSRAACPTASMWLRSRAPLRCRLITSGGCASSRPASRSRPPSGGSGW